MWAYTAIESQCFCLAGLRSSFNLEEKEKEKKKRERNKNNDRHPCC